MKMLLMTRLGRFMIDSIFGLLFWIAFDLIYVNIILIKMFNIPEWFVVPLKKGYFCWYFWVDSLYSMMEKVHTVAPKTERTQLYEYYMYCARLYVAMLYIGYGLLSQKIKFKRDVADRCFWVSIWWNIVSVCIWIFILTFVGLISFLLWIFNYRYMFVESINYRYMFVVIDILVSILYCSYLYFEENLQNEVMNDIFLISAEFNYKYQTVKDRKFLLIQKFDTCYESIYHYAMRYILISIIEPYVLGNSDLVNIIFDYFYCSKIRFVPHMTAYEAEKLTVGDKIDFRYSSGKYFAATIMERRNADNHVRIRAHINGARKTGFLDLKKCFYLIAEYGSITARESHRLKDLTIGCRVNVNPQRKYHSGWTTGVVEEFDICSGQTLVRYVHRNHSYLYWTHLDNEQEIAEIDTLQIIIPMETY
eukprot:242740_1